MRNLAKRSLSAIAMAASITLMLAGCANGTGGNNGGGSTALANEKPVDGGTRLADLSGEIIHFQGGVDVESE